MKQNITEEQLLELDEQKIYKLVVYKLNLFMTSNPDYQWYSEQITIGKMIEILSTYDIDIMSNYYKVNEWTITFYKEEHHIFRNIELCDALWEGIKAIL